MTALTARQARFVDEYAICMNATEAARRAGYSPKTARVIGQENLLKPAVKQALEARQEAFRAELGISRQDIVAGILSAIQMGREQRNPAVMIQGCVQLAKLLGLYEPERLKVDMTVDTASLQARFAAMPDEELLRIAYGKISQVRSERSPP